MPVDQFTPYIPKGSAAASDQENDSWSKNELIIASEEGNFKKVMKLLQDNPNLEAKDSQGNTALHKAKTVEVATLLIDRKANIHAKNTKGLTPLHHAADNGRLGIVKLLLDRDADIEARTEDGRTAMFWAHNKEMTDELMNKGAEINARDNTQTTPLHYAAFWGAPDVLQTLTSRGGDVNAANASGNTPLHWASTAQVAVALLQQRADPTAKDITGKAALHHASVAGNAEVVSALIEAKADVNAEDSQNADTALHLAAENGRTQATEVLLASGAQPNYKNVYGECPLHKAVKRRKSGVLTALLANKADPNIRSLEGNTPMDLTKDLKLQEMLSVAGGALTGEVPQPSFSPPVTPMNAAEQKPQKANSIAGSVTSMTSSVSPAQAAVREVEQARAQMTDREGSAQRLQQMHMRMAPGMEKQSGCKCCLQ